MGDKDKHRLHWLYVNVNYIYIYKKKMELSLSIKWRKFWEGEAEDFLGYLTFRKDMFKAKKKERKEKKAIVVNFDEMGVIKITFFLTLE